MYFLSFLDWVKSCGYVKLRFQAKTKVSQTSVAFVKFARGTKRCKKPKWQDTQKSEKSRIAKTTKLVVLSVKSVLTLAPPCTVIYLVVLIEPLLYCIFVYMSIVY